MERLAVLTAIPVVVLLGCRPDAPKTQDDQGTAPGTPTAASPSPKASAAPPASSAAPQSDSRVGNFVRNSADDVAKSVEQDVNRITSGEKTRPPMTPSSSGQKTLSLNNCTYTDSSNGALGNDCGPKNACPATYTCKLIGGKAGWCVPTAQHKACTHRH